VNWRDAYDGRLPHFALKRTACGHSWIARSLLLAPSSLPTRRRRGWERGSRGQWFVCLQNRDRRRRRRVSGWRSGRGSRRRWGGGVGRVAPRKSLGGKPPAIISRSNSSPTKTCPGTAVSSGEDHCPSEEASPGERVRNPKKVTAWPGYTPSRCSRIPAVANRTASPRAK
jgi:hypothetical protein